MLDFNPLFEFSRANCVSICAFLVPANLLLTLQTIVLVGLRCPQVQVRQAALLACIPALLMVLHVGTWFIIGVVMIPTFILLGLSLICSTMNIWAITHCRSLEYLLKNLLMIVSSKIPLLHVSSEGL